MSGYPLDPEFLARLEAHAVRFAREAGEIVLGHFRTGITVEYKSQDRLNPVTAADRESEAHLRAAISAAYPGHSILGEEGDDLTGDGSGFLWVLDPLDGTTNFVNGLPLFAVSIGVLYHDEPVAAAVFMPAPGPMGNGLFHARAGGGAFLDGVPLAVAPGATVEPSALVGLPGHYFRRIRFGGPLRGSPGEARSLGTIAVEAALVAAGTLHYAYFGRPKIWDIAGAALLVKEAGGLVLQRQQRHGSWKPLSRFVPTAVQGPALEGYRRWGASIIAGNPEVAWTVAANLRRRPRILEPVGTLLRKARQLPLPGR